MKTISIVLCGIGTAAGYVALSYVLSGERGYSLAVVLGTVVALALSGLRTAVVAPAKAKAKEKAKHDVQKSEDGERVSESRSEVDERNGEETAGENSRWTAEGDSVSVEQPTDDGREEHTSDVPQSAGYEDLSSDDRGDAIEVRALPQDESDVKAPAFFQRHLPTPILSDEESPVEIWERARVMEHNVIPDFEHDAEYLNLVFSAAEGGHVPALAKLGDYAFRRGAFVEAYFWTTIARRRVELADDVDLQALKEINAMLHKIRREWTVAGQPPEFENVYANFPAERGDLGRAFLQFDGGTLTNQARSFIYALAEMGNPDALLYLSDR